MMWFGVTFTADERAAARPSRGGTTG